MATQKTPTPSKKTEQEVLAEKRSLAAKKAWATRCQQQRKEA
jgi:hypothetical protein